MILARLLEHRGGEVDGDQLRGDLLEEAEEVPGPGADLEHDTAGPNAGEAHRIELVEATSCAGGEPLRGASELRDYAATFVAGAGVVLFGQALIYALTR